MDELEQLHAALDFSSYEPELRRIGSVWKDITALQKRVKANPAALKQYRQYLERSIKTLKAKGIDDPELQDDELLAECQRLADAFCVQSAVAAHADSRLPGNIFDWCQTWLPREYDAYAAAWAELEGKRTMRNFTKSRLATEVLLAAYIAGFE